MGGGWAEAKAPTSSATTPSASFFFLPTVPCDPPQLEPSGSGFLHMGGGIPNNGPQLPAQPVG
eukprot:9676289-Prorocentrum_lima.AAC.1